MQTILLLLLMPIAFNVDIKSINDAQAYFEKGEKADCKKCFFTKADNIMAKASLEEKHIIIVEYFLKSDSKFIRPYIKEKLQKGSSDILSLDWLLFTLKEKHTFKDIPFFCHLLINPFRVGREGEISSLVALGYLQSSIPIEYDISYKEFAQSIKYRIAIANRYMKWYKSIRTPLLWYPEYNMFLPEKYDREKAEKHLQWILDTGGLGIDAYPFSKWK
jgi:hypothetical protein